MSDVAAGLHYLHARGHLYRSVLQCELQDLQQYLVSNRPKMAILNETGIPLQLMSDVAAGLHYLHARGHLYRHLRTSNILVRNATGISPRGVVGCYAATSALHELRTPDTPEYNVHSEIWALGTLIWDVCTWGALKPDRNPPPPDLPCVYRNHLYQIMQLCWNLDPSQRPSAAQVLALLQHLHHTHTHTDTQADFEQRWQNLKPNHIPKVDEHVALVHAPSTSTASNFTESEEFEGQTTRDALSVEIDTGVSRSSSIMSDKDPLSVQIRSESLNNLHGSLDDVRNIYLTHNETATLECHQGNIGLEEREQDRSDSSVDPWVKDLIAGSQDDVSYYRDVSDVIKNLDNILNSEKTSSSESSHQASPSRDNLSLDCKKDYPVQSSMVKSPGITNFKNLLEMGFDDQDETCNDDDEIDRDTIGTLSHSFERHSDTASQHTLENLTPETPIKDLDVINTIDSKVEAGGELNEIKVDAAPTKADTELPKENIDNSDSELPKKDLCVVSLSSVSENEQLNVKDCVTSCDNLAETIRTQVEPKSIDNTVIDHQKLENKIPVEVTEDKLVTKKETGLQLKRENKEPENNGTDDTILPRITEIATDMIENEVIHPAIDMVSRMKEKRELKSQVAKQNEEIPPRLVVRETEAILKSSHDNAKEATNALIEEERKVFESTVNSVVAQSATQVETPTKEDVVSETRIEVESLAAQIVEEVCSHERLPEPVQTNNCNTTIVNTETEKADMQIPVDNLHEELGFSSNFTDINSEMQVKDEPQFEPLPPELVQNFNHEVIKKADTPHLVNAIPNETFKLNLATDNANENKVIPNEIIDNDEIMTSKETIQSPMKEEAAVEKKSYDENVHQEDKIKDIDSPRSDKKATDQSTDSTVYMDLINATNSETNKSEIPDENVKEFIQSCLGKSSVEANCSIIKDDSTVYLDLPNVVKDTNEFLHSERSLEDNICTSTPKGSECSVENTLECSFKENENTNISDTKVADETAIAKTEQKLLADLLSPFDSPSKSHPTDTYDENSSVVLGPFENCADLKSVKSEIDLPKEELLAFSSNFSEINLETPSPLRDGNFLIEVPDIASEDLQFDDGTLSEDKKETDNTDETDQSATTKHISPSTPPNSPGIYLASTSQQKYLVDIELDPPETQSYPPIETDSGLSSLQKEIDLNQIELQITTKLAMAENENNMNLEYSGPLTVEGLVSEDDAILRESDAIPEAFLAGNGGSIEERSEGLSLDEECVAALRNELELKLPLAQVAGIEPAVEAEWGELPPPPELVVHYGAGALSPILEETKHQLHQYETDAWNPSTRTDSSESYPEPCNDSTAEVTDLPTNQPDEQTYTIRSKDASANDTYTLQKDIPTSRELTMSADSLNGSPYKKLAQNDPLSPIDDRTYNKTDDEKISNCERISQVSPFLTSPTTDTSAPDSVDNATGVSTLSKTTLPTDAKHSKPSELSKATSIDSWCSNDTLYNVEENFDDLVLEADVPEFKELVKSASTETLTHQDDEKEVSHCSTYIVHDSKSEACETFTPDSITANDNDNYTYTKVKTEATRTTPSVVTKSDEKDSKNQTKDLAYGTLPSYSNCTTELISGIEDPWKFAQPEMVRRSPINDEVTFSPPRVVEEKETVLEDSPQTIDASFKKMDSVELSCIQDDINSPANNNSECSEGQIAIDSPNNYKNDMAPSITSTPVTVTVDNDNVEAIPMKLPNESGNTDTQDMDSIPNFQAFVQSAEIRPQDTTNNQDTALLLEGDSNTLSRNSNRDSLTVADRTPNYSDFEHSAVLKPQEVSVEKSSQNVESGMSSGDFRQFADSLRNCPQDISSLIDANSIFLNNERKSSDLAANSNEESSNDPTSQARMPESIQTEDVTPPNNANLVESQHVIPNINFSMYVTDLDEEETDQPHSIIFTEVSQPMRTISKEAESNNAVSQDDSNETKVSPNKTYDSHTETNQNTFNSHGSKSPTQNNSKSDDNSKPKLNGSNGVDDLNDQSNQSPKPEVFESLKTNSNSESTENNVIPNGSLSEVTEIKEVVCNGNANYATVNFINETFEELADSKAVKEATSPNGDEPNDFAMEIETSESNHVENSEENKSTNKKEMVNGVDQKIVAVTEDFLQNEKKFCTVDSYLPMLSDIRFTGPASEIMSTSFTQDSPPSPASPCERDSNTNDVADLVKEWDSDSDSHDTNSSSGEFIWKDGDGHETPLVTDTRFDHQQDGAASNPQDGGSSVQEAAGGGSSASGDSGSGSEGDEVEFVPSSWDCRAAPGKSSLRSLEQQPPADKKKVVFKRQKYHCVYEYPRELAEGDTHSPAYLPDLSTYCEWDPSSAEEAELGYGQLYGTPMDMFQLRSGISFGPDYDDDFFISSSARPFESLGIMSSASQFFPGMHLKQPSLLDRDRDDEDRDGVEDFPPPPSPLVTSLTNTRAPSLDFTTPDSGVEDITPGSTSTEEDFKAKKIDEGPIWKPLDSASSSESVSPSSPGGEALGGLRHTRDKLKLDLPPSPHIPSPRHNRVFNFILDKPKRRHNTEEVVTPLVMTDETPVITSNLPMQKDDDITLPEPTFSTFGKCKSSPDSDTSEQKIILTDEQSPTTETKEENVVKTETVKGEGTVLDSGDEDSGIESSSKASLERKTNVS
ncbi:hypothetical protein O0L34_g8534 [Tuta absoluta]|nr:hypothetical protein O0L34_g8534 [Tuta absoluta]